MLKNKSKDKKETDIQTLAMAFINNPNDVTFALLTERINWGLRSYIYKIVNDDNVTTELVMKTLEMIYYKRDMYDPNHAKFSTWMYKIALNNSLKYLQKVKNDKKYIIDENFADIYESILTERMLDSYECDDFVDMIFDKKTEPVSYGKEKVINDLYDASINSINYLPDNLRIVMYERLVNSKKIEQISEDNLIPLSSVKNWLRKGKVCLQQVIKERYTDLYDMYMEMNLC